ncbi:hypothetical protein Trydic_g22909 [Trypoxylus dichotomus]
MINMRSELTKGTQIRTGVRQRNSLSSFIFKKIMDRIIGKLLKIAGYNMGTTYSSDVCCADNTVLIADSEDNLQRLFCYINQSAKQLNTKRTGKMQTGG